MNCLQTVLLSCQDLLTWCSHLKIMLLSEEKVSSVAEVQILKSEHENVKSEIEMKEANFNDLAQRVEKMTEWNNPFKGDITAKWDQVNLINNKSFNRGLITLYLFELGD